MAAAIGTGSAAPKAVPMARKLAYRNLFHDQLSLFVTLVGIVFSVVLVAVQCSIYLGSEFRIVSVMDHIKTDLWVLPGGAASRVSLGCPVWSSSGLLYQENRLRVERRAAHRAAARVVSRRPSLF